MGVTPTPRDKFSHLFLKKNMSYKLISDAYSIDAETYQGDANSFTVEMISPEKSTWDYLDALGQKIGYNLTDSPETILQRAVNYVIDSSGYKMLRIAIWHDSQVGSSLKKYLGEYVGGVISNWFSVIFDKYKITAVCYKR